MIKSAPQKFSNQWWAWLLAGTLFFGLSTAAVLWYLGVVPNLTFFLVVVLGSCVGDILLALSLDAINPTRVVVGPGDRQHNDAALRDSAIVQTAFNAANEGMVSVRGENWRAKARVTGAAPNVGEPVKIVDRDGLVLIVERVGNDI